MVTDLWLATRVRAAENRSSDSSGAAKSRQGTTSRDLAGECDTNQIRNSSLACLLA